MRLFVMVYVILLSAAALAVGAGGGGYGGGGSCSGICELECFDSGAVRFLAAAEMQNLTATFLETGENFSVTGTWNFNRFVSDEVLFTRKGVYSINGFPVNCPGFGFSCLTANITINKCTRHEGYMESEFATKNFDSLDKIKYEFKAGGNYFYYTQALHSGQVKSLKITNLTADTYLINVTVEGNVTHIQLSDTRCAAKTILECLPAASDGGARTFLCSDLSALQERVRCRLGLTEEQRHTELRLQYLPEECRALSGAEQDECINTYDSVQRCWTYPQGEARVNCVKNIIGFTSIGEEKAKCGPDTSCLEKIKKNVFTLIKFRFYDLEGRAEELYSRNPELVTSVVSQLEQKKQEFNTAKTLQEKKGIVLEVREIWKGFVRGIR